MYARGKSIRGDRSGEMTIVEEKIKQLLFENGVCFDEEDLEYEFAMDSLVYMSFLVGVEESLGIVIPDEYLVNVPKTYLELVDMVNKIINLDK